MLPDLLIVADQQDLRRMQSENVVVEQRTWRLAVPKRGIICGLGMSLWPDHLDKLLGELEIARRMAE
jgi:hypothetical protein